jgi:hypothetical protein
VKHHFVIAIYAEKKSASRFHKLAKSLGENPEQLAKDLITEGIESRRKKCPSFDRLYRSLYSKAQGIGKGA